MKHLLVLALVIVLATSCVTPQSTPRNIERQIKAVEIAQDKVAEWQEELQRRKEELDLLRIQRAQDASVEQ